MPEQTPAWPWGERHGPTPEEVADAVSGVRNAEVEQLRATLARVQQLLDTGPIGTCCDHLVRAALGQPQPTCTNPDYPFLCPGPAEGAAL